ncbi:predicted protein [Nematostella vectensis]|uniref:Uncharacterized protein n=1 Tax=Nematostella vectensis TaxID=45351 RepID=A7SE80_NEMVE|nr:medium-chain acyl-CoA ligase ACSF2, mitochondrial [Nematostella vectensis]EDO37992.1 predicted protein [Nematostella vectensis]|eukprot:XP_001630055.1 predicted protein [Nematostella vectensis]
MTSQSYIHRPHTTPLEHRTLFQLLDHHAAKCPNKEALIYRDDSGNRTALTFREYKDQSQALAAGLLEKGLRRGDRVLVLLSNSVEFAVILLALTRLGAVPLFVELDVDDAILEMRGQVSGVFYTEQDSKVITAVTEVLDSEIKIFLCIGSHDNMPNHKKVHSYDALLQSFQDDDITQLHQAETEVQFDDPALVIFTSGSTGRPKPILYTHHGFVNGALSVVHTFKATHDTIQFCDAPFDWIPGIGFSLALVSILGMTLVAFPPNLSIKGHVIGIMLKIISEERCTHAIMLTYVMLDMVRYEGLPQLDLSQLKVCITGGQLTDQHLMSKVFSALPDLTSIVNSYGSTETFLPSGQVVTRHNIHSLDYGATEVNPGFEVKVVDDEGHVVPVGTPGELHVRGAGILQSANGVRMEGVVYEEKTPTGWYPSKDLSKITNDGRVRILGRKDCLIKSATESIYPPEVESVLGKHEKIASIIAIGIPDQRLGEVVCACVIIKPGFHGDNKAVIQEIDEWCAPKFYVSSNGMTPQPKKYVILENFPKTRTGKVDRKALKNIAIQKLGLMKDCGVNIS